MKNSKILLDSNIIIHRETEKIINPEIGKLFNILDKIKANKYIHPITKDEINKLNNKEKKQTFQIKLDAYNTLITDNKLKKEFNEISRLIDRNENDRNDSSLINEVYKGTVDFIITEVKKVHYKANLLKISDKVFTIESFLERVNVEYPDFTDYKILNVHKSYFGKINLDDCFFDTFKEDYNEFDKWFKRKSNEPVYVGYSENSFTAFLYLKIEYENENYSDIKPTFPKKSKR